MSAQWRRGSREEKRWVGFWGVRGRGTQKCPQNCNAEVSKGKDKETYARFPVAADDDELVPVVGTGDQPGAGLHDLRFWSQRPWGDTHRRLRLIRRRRRTQMRKTETLRMEHTTPIYEGRGGVDGGSATLSSLLSSRTLLLPPPHCLRLLAQEWKPISHIRRAAPLGRGDWEGLQLGSRCRTAPLLSSLPPSLSLSLSLFLYSNWISHLCSCSLRCSLSQMEAFDHFFSTLIRRVGYPYIGERALYG